MIPEFQVRDQDGNTVTQKDFEGKRIVLYFYPKDSTPGCTAEGLQPEGQLRRTSCSRL